MLALVVSFAAIAQEGKGKKNGHHKHNKEYRHKGGQMKGIEKLNLTDAQGAQLKAINTDFRTQMKALKENTSLSQEARQQQKQALIDNHRAQINAILTPEQRQQIESRKTRNKSKGKKHDRTMH